jgi:hypothetical protein
MGATPVMLHNCPAFFGGWLIPFRLKEIFPGKTNELVRPKSENNLPGSAYGHVLFSLNYLFLRRMRFKEDRGISIAYKKVNLKVNFFVYSK